MSEISNAQTQLDVYKCRQDELPNVFLLRSESVKDPGLDWSFWLCIKIAKLVDFDFGSDIAVQFMGKNLGPLWGDHVEHAPSGYRVMKCDAKNKEKTLRSAIRVLNYFSNTRNDTRWDIMVFQDAVLESIH